MLQLHKWLFTILLTIIQFKHPSNCCLLILSKDSVWNVFKPIASVFDLVGITKSCENFLTIFVQTFQIATNLWITAAQMIVHHSISIIPIYNPSKHKNFNKKDSAWKSFMVVTTVVCAVGPTKFWMILVIF